MEDQKNPLGLIHFGMWVDNLDESAKKITNAGGSYVTGRKETGPNVYYEVKYKTPEGIVFDITESGWKGAVKEVKPALAGCCKTLRRDVLPRWHGMACP